MDGWVKFCFGESARHPVIVEPPPRPRGRPAYQWTEEQVEIIKQYYPSMGGKAVAEMTGAPPRTVKDKANRMGVRVNQTRMIEARQKNSGNFGRR